MKIVLNIFFSLIYIGMLLSICQYAVGNSIVFISTIGIIILYIIKSIIEIKEKHQIFLNLGLLTLWLNLIFVFKSIPILISSLIALGLIILYYFLIYKNKKSSVFLNLIILTIIAGSYSVLNDYISNSIINAVVFIFFALALLLVSSISYFKVKSFSKIFSDINLSGVFTVFSVCISISLFSLNLLPPFYTEMSNAEKKLNSNSEQNQELFKEELIKSHNLINEILDK